MTPPSRSTDRRAEVAGRWIGRGAFTGSTRGVLIEIAVVIGLVGLAAAVALVLSVLV